MAHQTSDTPYRFLKREAVRASTISERQSDVVVDQISLRTISIPQNGIQLLQARTK